MLRDPDILTAAEVADRLGCSAQTITAAARAQVDVVDVSEFLPHSVPEMVTVEKAGNE